MLLTFARKGESVLQKLSLQHLAELRVQGPALITALEGIMKDKEHCFETHKSRGKALTA